MSDFYNEFNIGGQNNTVNITQTFTDGGNEALALVLKFLATILLSPVLIPLVLTLNGYKMLMDKQSGAGEDV